MHPADSSPESGWGSAPIASRSRSCPWASASPRAPGRLERTTERIARWRLERTRRDSGKAPTAHVLFDRAFVYTLIKKKVLEGLPTAKSRKNCALARANSSAIPAMQPAEQVLLGDDLCATSELCFNLFIKIYHKISQVVHARPPGTWRGKRLKDPSVQQNQATMDHLPSPKKRESNSRGSAVAFFVCSALPRPRVGMPPQETPDRAIVSSSRRGRRTRGAPRCSALHPTCRIKACLAA